MVRLKLWMVLAADFLDELDATLLRILQFPEAWSIISKPFRHCSLRRFPYTIIYTLETPNDILVVSVFRQSRKPMAWEKNL